MKKCGLMTGILGLVAAIVFFTPMSDCSFPRLIAPICGIVAVVTLFHLVRRFVLSASAHFAEVRPGADSPAEADGRLADCAAGVSAVVFMLTPAVRTAATHFELSLLAFTWALLIVALAVPFLRPARVGLFPILAGVAWALGFLASALFLALLPLYLILIVQVSRRGGIPAAPKKTVIPLVLFLLSSALAFFAAARILHTDLSLFFRRTMMEFSSYYTTPGWFFVFAFTTLPFLTVLFSEDGALRERPGSVQLLFHGALSFVTVLAVVPPLSPSALMAPYGRLPVATSAFAAAVAGYLVAYWWINRRQKTARVVGGILCLVLAGVSVWNLVSFDGKFVRRVVVRMDARRAREILRTDPDAPLPNYVMGSLALTEGRTAEAEPYLRKAADIPEPVPFALNDLAEVLRRGKNYAEAERYARKCVECAPKMYIGWETLGSVLMDAGKNLDEAEAAVRKACELSKGRDGKAVDVRMLVSLARVQLKRGDRQRARETIGEIKPRIKELSDSDRAEFEKLQAD